MAGMGSGMGLAGKVRAGGATRGKVKKWFEGRGSLPGGYGFVVPIEGEHAGKDIYIHHSSFGGGSLNLGWDVCQNPPKKIIHKHNTTDQLRH